MRPFGKEPNKENRAGFATWPKADNIILMGSLVGLKSPTETTLKSHPDIPQLARIIARECGGLPIVLNLIGRTMSSKRTVREWHQTVDVLVSSTAGYPEREVPILKFTYDNLPGEDIKACFLYCALFPKNCYISKQVVVDRWVGKRMIDVFVYEMIDDLVRMGLLLENESGYGVKLHEIVRDMALWVASQASDYGRQKELLVVVGGDSIQEMPKVNDWRMVTRMSVTSTLIENISDSPDCSQQTTLFLQGNSKLNSIWGDFFQWMTSLVELNLSHNRELSELPEEVSSLVSLQFLNLSFTSIKRLPLGLKELKKLIHLDLDYTSNLKEIDVIASLLNLQVLWLFRSVPMDSSRMELIRKLWISLRKVCLTLKGDDVLQLFEVGNFGNIRTCIQRLSLSGATIWNGGISLLERFPTLRELDMTSCCVWETRLERLESFPELKNIRKVTLDGCYRLRDLTSLLGTPCLEDLSLARCSDITQLISKEKSKGLKKTIDQPFQNLTRLSLYDVPTLEIIHWTPLRFPVLKFLRIRLCPALRRLPFNSETAKGNDILLDIDEQCINGVTWEDEATKRRFSGFNSRGYDS